MRKAVEPVEARSIPPGWQTAYPRRSKIHDDPDTGLDRPVDVLVMRDGSLLVSGEQMGAIYRITYRQ